MNDFIQLLIQYWKPIVGLLFCVAGFVIALIKKKPVSDILSDIYALVIKAVNIVEVDGLSDPNLTGDLKLARATSYVMSWLMDKYPTLNVDRYFKVIEKVIEDILTTPHKKG